jgi:RNA polymerase sigma-70 factor (ECF subfamily)
MNSAGRSSVVSDVTSASIDGEALHQLVAAVQRGDRPAADRLVRDHDSWVRSVIYGVTGRPELVEDVAQQVWAQVWQRLGSLKDPQRLRPWLYRVARPPALDASIAPPRNRPRLGELEQAGDVRTTSGWLRGDRGGAG